MSDLQTAMQRVLPELKTTIKEWVQDETPPPNKNHTQKILEFVAAHPGCFGSDVARGVPGASSNAAMSSMLHQLEVKGYLTRTNGRPMRYTRTEKPYTPLTSEDRKALLKKATEMAVASRQKKARRKLAKQVKTKPLRVENPKAAPPPAPASAPAPSADDFVNSMNVRMARDVYNILKGMFGYD